MTKYRNLILKATQKYYDELNKEDFSHDFNHILRVERLAKRIAIAERADMGIIEASCLLFDVARILEDRGLIKDHAEEGSKIAKEVLEKVGFPKEKIKSVCHAILVHRKSKGRVPETIEAKILQDADYLDALGAINIVRVMVSSFQSKKYKRPIHINDPYDKKEIKSAIHYLMHQIEHPKLQPKNFHTNLGKELANERFNFVKEFTERFIEEWEGKR